MQKNVNRFVPPHGVEKRSESTGPFLGHPRDKAAGRSAGTGSRNAVLDDLTGGRERTAKQGRPNTAERMRGFETHNEANETASQRAKERKMVSLHDLALCKLDALRIVETELDLNFQSIKEFRRKKHAAVGTAEGLGKTRSSLSGRKSSDVHELAMQMELQSGPGGSSSRAKKGSEQNVLLYSTQPFEVMQSPSEQKSGAALAAWGCTTGFNKPKGSPNLLDLLTPSGGGMPTQSTEQKDGSHSLQVNLRESVPQSLVFQQDPHESNMKGLPKLNLDGSVKVKTKDSLSQVEVQCDLLEKNLEEQLTEHLAQLSAQLVETTATPSENAKKDSATSTSEEQKSDGAALGKAKVYLRCFRSVLRLLAPLIPNAASVLEGSLKGTMLAIDGELTTAWQTVASLKEQVSRRASDDFNSDVLNAKLRQISQRNDELKASLAESNKKFKSETAALQEKIAELMDEIVHLSPNTSDLEGVAGKMSELGNLMGDMEDECARQARILNDMGNYALRIIQKKDEDPKKHRSRGRCIELPNGEIELRLYDSEDAHVGVTEAELCPTDETTPIRLRTLKVRQCLAKFSSRVICNMRIQDLCTEIDRIYAAKMTADVEADMAGMPRAELLDFIVHFYLNELHFVSLAEKKLYEILSCIYKNSGQQVPLKVELFARFLEFSDFERALPLSVLNIALKSKRTAQAHLQRPGTGPKETGTAKKGAPAGEGTLSVAAAYEAVSRTLPEMGTLAYKELFQGLAKHAEIEEMKGTDSKREGYREWIVLVLLLHDKLKKDAAPMMRDLIHRIEQQSSMKVADATFDDYHQALRDAQVFGVEDKLWKSKLEVPGMPNAISPDVLLETLGGGSLSRLPKASITETGFMAVVTDSVCAGFVDSTKLLKQVWETQRPKAAATPALRYADFKVLTQFVEPNLTDPEIKRFFTSAIELSQACTQTAGALCPVTGTMDPVSNNYGGDVISFQILLQAALRCGLFLQDGNSGDGHQPKHPQQSPRDSQAMPKKKGKR